MYQHFPFCIRRDTGVETLVKTFIRIWDMAGSAAQSMIITPALCTSNTYMATLAIGTDIGEDGLFRMFIEGGLVNFRQFYQ